MTKITASAANKSSTRKPASTKATNAKNAKGIAITSVAKPVSPARNRTPQKRVDTVQMHPEERHRLIEIAAYYIAEKRGFRGRSSNDDWLQAEREVDAMAAAGKFKA